jgi:hypothetical protein
MLEIVRQAPRVVAIIGMMSFEMRLGLRHDLTSGEIPRGLSAPSIAVTRAEPTD